MQRRIAAYGVCRDPDGRVLLVRASGGSARRRSWLLPGGGVEHGEHPADAVVREVREETGLAVAIVRVYDVISELLPTRAGVTHNDAILYELAVTGGVLRPEVAGSSDDAQWWQPTEAGQLPLSAVAAAVLGLAVPTTPEPGGSAAAGGAVGVGGAVGAGSGVGSGDAAAGPPRPPGPRPRPRRGQRFGVYGLVTDPTDRVLLTLIADSYPGAGHWHLPGGGTDFGEQPRAALMRELMEESGQVGRIVGVLGVTHSHNRAAVGPEGHPIDWHAVRASFAVCVDAPTTPRVMEVAGSTARAGWFTRAGAAALPLTDVAAELLQVDARPRSA